MKVYLAQESRVVGGILRRALQSTRYSGATVLEFRQGVDLLQSLKAETDSDTLVVLDWNLPGFDLSAFLATSQGIKMLDRVAILLCINASQTARAENLVRKGAVETILRPFSDEEFCAKIEQLFRTRSTPTGTAASIVLRDILTNARVQVDLPPLMSLPSGILASLFEKSSPRRHPAGTVILESGSRVDELPFVTSGEIEIEDSRGRITRGSGECFGERAFICGETAKLRVRALTPVDLVEVPKESMVHLARAHAAVRTFLKMLLMRPSAADSKEGVSEFSGTLASLGFPDLVQYLHTSRKSGLLILEDGATQGRIAFQGGEVRDATSEGQTGEAAFRALAGMTEGCFSFIGGPASESRTIFQSTLRLLMECYQSRQDGDASIPVTPSGCCAQAG